MGVCRGSLVLVEYAAQKTLLSSRVQLAEKSFPFGAGDHLQSWAVVKGGKFEFKTRVCVWLTMPWFCCKMKHFLNFLHNGFPKPDSVPKKRLVKA